MNHQRISPGRTIGVLGSGQLGRMFAIAARRMGYRVHVLSPDDDTPTGQVADVEIRADYADVESVERFASSVDVVTFEFENVPAGAIDAVAKHVPVRPGGHVLHTTQNRLREKSFLQDAGLPVAPFCGIHSLEELQSARRGASAPAVLKTAAWGYDGKGQRRIDPTDDLAQVWNSIQTDEAILEDFIDFERELSVVAARGLDGQIACYDPIENLHANHILDISRSPGDVTPSVAHAAREIAHAVLQKLDVVGVLCVEFFLTRSGDLLINELAPRPHNSGHLTIDAHVTCQFEQQVRAVCGLPLGSTRQLLPAAMVNLLGEQWNDHEPAWHQACATPELKLHLYGKREPRQGRKMGHLTAVADTSRAAQQLVMAAREALGDNTT